MTARSSHLLAALPEALLAQAELVGNGEPLWPAEAAVQIVAWAGAADWAIAVGEVYRARGQMQTSFVFDWETPRKRREPWPDYARRAGETAQAKIEAAGEDDVPGVLRFFFVAFPPGC
jgi:hypothetical protein